jgi:hypothetical protein
MRSAFGQLPKVADVKHPLEAHPDGLEREDVLVHAIDGAMNVAG